MIPPAWKCFHNSFGASDLTWSHSVAKSERNWHGAVYNILFILLGVNIHTICCRNIKVWLWGATTDSLRVLDNIWHMQLCSLSNIQKILNCETDLALRVLAKERYTCNEFWLSWKSNSFSLSKLPYIPSPTFKFFVVVVVFWFFYSHFPWDPDSHTLREQTVDFQMLINVQPSDWLQQKHLGSFKAHFCVHIKIF